MTTDCHCHILPGLDDGAQFQRNLGSLEGMYGEAVSVRAEALEAEGLYEWTGSDLHSRQYAAFFDRFLFCE